MTIRGGCCCGAVRYEVDGSLRNARCCHCADCRKAFSSASSAYAEVDAALFSWTLGEHDVTHYRSAEGWGLGFCRVCGSTLCGLYNGKLHGVTLGSVNGDPGVQITMHIFVGSKAPWHEIGVMHRSMLNDRQNQALGMSKTAQQTALPDAPSQRALGSTRHRIRAQPYSRHNRRLNL